MRVLLVDDDPVIRMITSFLLEQDGHVVLEAEDADAARMAFAAQRPDLVLMDVNLGDADGVELAAELLAGAGADPPKLVFLTGAARSEQVARMQSTAAAGVLQKPFDPSSFLSTLHAIVGQ